MKDNARHVPGSIRSFRAVMFQSVTSARRFQSLWKSTYKTQTKCIQNRKCDFFNYSTSTTYNFNAVKCLNFPGLRVLTVGTQSLAAESHDVRFKMPIDCYPFSLREKARMRDKLVTLFGDANGAHTPLYTVQNETKRDAFKSVSEPITLYQRLTTTLFHDVPFFGGASFRKNSCNSCLQTKTEQNRIKPNRFRGGLSWSAIHAPPLLMFFDNLRRRSG